MPFDLVVNFDFLCAFAPPKPFDQNPDECWVVLPDHRKSLPQERHFPCLLYNRAHRRDQELIDAGVVPRPRVPAFASGHPDHLIFLDGEEVEIRPNGKSPKQHSLAVGAIDHLLPIEKAGVGHDTLKRDLLVNPAPTGIAARLHLTEGSLEEQDLTEDEFIVLRNGTPPPVFTSELARRVSLTLPGLDFVDFVFRPLTTTAATERVLRLRTQGANRSEVTIRNCEFESIWRQGAPGYTAQASSEINLYFRLATQYDSGSPPPTMQVRMRTLPTGPNNVCGPAAFSGLG